MKILITGICGFVGSTLARSFKDLGHEVLGIDSFIRAGSEINRPMLKADGIGVVHADLRNQSDMDALPASDWVIDAAANASVLAGVDGATSSRQLLEHNLLGTIHLLEYCKRHKAGFTLLSTSRVYSIPGLSALEVESVDDAYRPRSGQSFPEGISSHGVSENYTTAAPVSLYGATKLASETLALEYGASFGFPVWINRCGVLAGPGQFGRADQGIFAFWINAWLRRKPLRYIGFNGLGHQVRDCLYPADLIPAMLRQMEEPSVSPHPRTANFAGGVANSMSLAQLSRWCEHRFGPHPDISTPPPASPIASRPFDIPWMVLDSALACREWNWMPRTPMSSILEQIAAHAEMHPHWLEISA